MKKAIRNYLLRNTPESLVPIEDGVLGEASKIDEEYHEFIDAINQQLKTLQFIEACDLAEACFQYNFKQFKVPSLIMINIIYLRRLYKPIRNRIYTWCGLCKEDFNG